MKILFVRQQYSSFVNEDIKILQSAHDIRELHFRGLKDIIALWKGVKWCDVTFCWFGKLHAFWAVFFSKLLGKKSAVIAGGDEVAYVPSIKYGMFNYWWKKWCPLFVFRYADLILPVSKFTQEETIKNAKADPKKIRMVYNGFSTDNFKRIETIKKEDLVITIGSVSKEGRIKKGLELFIKSASFLPEVKFILIGPDIDGSLEVLRKIAPNNVDILGGVYGEKLIEMYNKAKVYVQASVHESFGCSIAEAMLCECIPVVSRRAAIPEVVGDCGIYLDDLTPEVIAVKIKEALILSDDFGRRARERTCNLFSIEKRSEKLCNALASLILKSKEVT